MKEFSIVFPQIKSDQFWASSNGSKRTGFNRFAPVNKEIKSGFYDAARFRNFMNENQVVDVRYATSHAKDTKVGRNFHYATKWPYAQALSDYSLYEYESFPGKLGAAQECLEKGNSDLRYKVQLIDSIDGGGQRKINAIDVYGHKPGYPKVKVSTVQTIMPDGSYQVLRRKGREIVSGYRCNLNDITNTAEVYDKTAKAFVKEVKEKGSKTLGELLKKAKV